MNKIALFAVSLFAALTVACGAPVPQTTPEGQDCAPTAQEAPSVEPTPEPTPVQETPTAFERSQSFVRFFADGSVDSCTDVRVFADEGSEELEKARLFVEQLGQSATRIQGECRTVYSDSIQASCQSSEPVGLTVADTWYYRFANTREDVQACVQAHGAFHLP